MIRRSNLRVALAPRPFTGRRGGTPLRASHAFAPARFSAPGQHGVDVIAAALWSEIDEAAWSCLCQTVRRPFVRPESGKTAVKVINYYGDEMLRVSGV